MSSTNHSAALITATNMDPFNYDQTVLDILERHSKEIPDKKCLHWVGSNGLVKDSLTFRHIWERSEHIAIHLIRDHQLASQETVLLVFPFGLDFIVAFLGVQRAGGVPVLVPPPNPAQLDKDLAHFNKLAHISDARIALTLGSYSTALNLASGWRSIKATFWRTQSSQRWIDLTWVSIDAIRSQPATHSVHTPHVDLDHLAFLQYTSGSTGDPKGVEVMHRNLVANLQAICQTVPYTPDTVGCTWLPHFHDFCLIGCVLTSFYAGGTVYLQSPLDFVKNPNSWTRAMSSYGATHTAAPNFALDLAARKYDGAPLDLSALRCVVLGAEPIRKTSLERFHSCFGPSGFLLSAYKPAYGLAEATLGLSFYPHQAKTIEDLVGPDDAVLCGPPCVGVTMRIVDPKTGADVTNAGHEREIWVASPSVSSAYHNLDEASRKTFQNHLDGYPGLRFLRTGDLGKLWHAPDKDGIVSGSQPQLMVTGRLKDIFIIHGRNVYPQDIEELVWTTWPDIFKAGSVAVFAVNKQRAMETGDEDNSSSDPSVVLCAEVRKTILSQSERNKTLAGVLQQIPALVLSSMGIMLDHIVLTETGQIPRTTSGKIRRKQTTALYEGDKIKVILDDSNPRSSWLKTVVGAISGIPNIPADLLQNIDSLASRSLTEVGCDSLMLFKIASHLSEEFNVDIQVSDLVNTQSLNSLASLVIAAKGSKTRLSNKYVGEPLDDFVPMLDQKRLYLESAQSVQHSLAYHISHSIQLVSETKISARQLRKAILHVAATNDSLRTTFTVNSKGEPVAKVLPISKLPAQLVRVLTQPEATDEDEDEEEAYQAAMSYVQRWARDGLDLSKAAFETVLIPISDSRVLFAFKIHHIVFDGFSAALLSQRIAAAYANETGSEVTNSSSSPQFSLLADDLDRKNVEVEERVPVDTFWQSIHRESPKPFIRHPRQRPATRNNDGLVTLNLPAATSHGVHQLARASGCSSFVYLLTAFMQLLSDFEMQDDFLVACPVTKRRDTCVRSMIGFLVNTMLIRAPAFCEARDQPASLSFVSRQVQSYISDPEFDFAAVLHHIQNPTPKGVQKEAAPATDPVFLWFNMHEFALEAELQTSKLTVTRSTPLWSGVAKFPLGLELFPKADGGIECVWEYKGDFYSKAEVQQMASAFGNMLELAISHGSDDGRWVHAKDSISLRALQTAGPDVKPGSRDTSDLVSLFRASVQQFGTRVAIEDSVDHRTYTYNDVDRHTDHLASLIQKHLAAQVDHKPTRHVMLALERGPHLTMAMLAVVKAGAAYVPLDLSNPAERNRYITAQVGAQLMLVDHRTESRFVEDLATRHLNAETVISSEPPTLGSGTLPVEIDPSSVCYVLFTSGSTGVPKGCVMTHAAVTASVLGHLQATQCPKGVRTLQFSRYTFDHSVLELFMTMHRGGTLVTAPHDELLSNLSGIVSDSMISMCVLTPTVASVLPDPQDLPWLRVLILSGEPTDHQLRKKWLSPNVKTKLFNLYGTTEGGIHQFCCRMTGEQLLTCVGQPLPGMRATILGRDQQPCPLGAVGHIWVAGPYLGQGYLDDAVTTSRYFKQLAYSGIEGLTHAHDTGDLGYIDVEGNIQLVGRQDHQVKVRGQRVELGEVEGQISQVLGELKTGSTRSAVVLRSVPDLHEDVLVAFVVSDEADMPVGTACPRAMLGLEESLQEKLPQYMIPTFFVPIVTFPLTSSGKLDRKSLTSMPWQSKYHRVSPAASSSSLSVVSSASSAERYGILEILLDTIGEVTGIHATPDTRLMEQGITSITAMRILAVLRTRHRLNAKINDFFEHPTIASIAASIEGRQSYIAASSMVHSFVSVERARTALTDRSAMSAGSSARSEATLDAPHAIFRQSTSFKKQPEGRYDAFPPTTLQESYLIGRRTGVDLSLASKTMIEVLLPGDFSIDRIRAAFRVLVQRHDALRLTFDTVSLQQRVLPFEEVAEQIPVSIHDFSGESLSSPERDDLVQSFRNDVESLAFDPSCWPLFDVSLATFPALKIGDHNTLHLWLSLDLLIIDAKSVQTLCTELRVLLNFESEVIGIDDPLKSSVASTTFRDYVVWHQNGSFDANAYADAQVYWRERLPTIPLAPALPMRSAGNHAIDSASVLHLAHTFSESFWSRFVTQCKQHNLLPSAVLMTNFVDTLRLWSEEPYFTVNTTLFNREYVEDDIDKVIGDFTGGILFETPNEATADETSFSKRCHRVQKQLLSDISYSQYSSISVIRDLQRHHPGSLMPIVFTCVLPPGQTTETPSPTVATESLDFEVVGRKTQTSQVWLDFQVFPSLDGSNIELHLDYMDVFEPHVAQQLFGVFAKALERTLAPETKDMATPKLALTTWDQVHSFAQLPSAHLQPRLEANETSDPAICAKTLNLPDTNSLLIDGFVRSAERTPERTAIEAVDGTLTYGKLARYAALGAKKIDQLQRLTSNTTPVEPDNVAVLLDKSCGQIASVLAVLLSGNAYVPIDTESPSQRVAAIAAGADITLVITSRTVDADKVACFDRVLYVEDFNPEACEDETDICLSRVPLVRRRGDQLAYIIFTSGSTGKPKGVRISHHAALNTIASVINRFGLHADDCCFGLSKLSFDLSVYDIFGTLSLGAKLTLPHQDQLKDPAHWIEMMHQSGVTVWNSVPMLLQMLVAYQSDNEMAEGALSALRVVLLSGDRIPVDLLRGLFARAEQTTQFYALGGATEASIWSNYHPISADDVGRKCARPIPYGVPLANQQMFVYKSTLFGSLQETPDFVIGELYIAGDGLAQGYTDVVQTQKAFIRHPETGLQLYRTGDVARYLPNGLIEFVGRNDFLVKVGGNRVELQEISTAASSMQGIGGICVDVHRDQLVGFVVPTDETENRVTGMESIPLLTDEADRKLHKVEHQHDPSLPVSARSVDSINSITIAAPSDFQTKVAQSRKSTYSFSPRPVSTDTLQNFLMTSLSPTHWENGSEDTSQALSSLLSVLIPVESNGSRKYRYPSAGATYSVNCLVSILNLADHVSGIYAFDTLGSKLVLVQAHEPEKDGVVANTRIELCFWSDLAKIAPLYGNKSLEFARLEAGYAIGAMNRELSRSSALHLEICESSTKIDPLLSSMELPLTSARLSLARRDSIHRNEEKSSPLISLFQRTDSDQFWLKEASQKRFRASLTLKASSSTPTPRCFTQLAS